MIPPTSGTAIVSGFDITKNINEVRSSIGLCPQFNILFDDMTVSEHLHFYGRLKGKNPNRLTLFPLLSSNKFQVLANPKSKVKLPDT